MLPSQALSVGWGSETKAPTCLVSPRILRRLKHFTSQNAATLTVADFPGTRGLAEA
jgi:hypothetical protein